MNKLIVIAFIFGLSNTFLLGQDLELHLDIINPTLSKIEPLFYKLRLVNNGDSIKHIRYPWQSNSLPQLEYFDDSKKEWHPLEESEERNSYRFAYYKNDTYIAERMLFMRPNDTLVEQLIYLPTLGGYYSSFYAFEKSKYSQIRAVFVTNKNFTNVVYSNIVDIHITDYTAEDSLALDYLERLELPHFIYEGLVLRFNTGSLYENQFLLNDSEKAATLISNFPNSRFALWAQLHIIWKEMSKVTPYEEESQGYILEAEKKLKTLLNQADDLSKPYVVDILEWTMFKFKRYNDVDEYIEDCDYIEKLRTQE